MKAPTATTGDKARDSHAITTNTADSCFDVAGTAVCQVDTGRCTVSVRAYYDVSTLLRQLGLA